MRIPGEWDTWLCISAFFALVGLCAALGGGCGKITTEPELARDAGGDRELGAGGHQVGVGGSGQGGAIAGVGGSGQGGTGAGGAAPCTVAADQQSYSCPGCVATCAKWCSDDTLNGARSAACRACPDNPAIDVFSTFGGKVSSCGPTGAWVCCRWDPVTLWPYCSGQLVCR